MFATGKTDLSKSKAFPQPVVGGLIYKSVHIYIHTHMEGGPFIRYPGAGHGSIFLKSQHFGS